MLVLPLVVVVFRTYRSRHESPWMRTTGNRRATFWTIHHCIGSCGHGCGGRLERERASVLHIYGAVLNQLWRKVSVGTKVADDFGHRHPRQSTLTLVHFNWFEYTIPLKQRKETTVSSKSQWFSSCKYYIAERKPSVIIWRRDGNGLVLYFKQWWEESVCGLLHNHVELFIFSSSSLVFSSALFGTRVPRRFDNFMFEDCVCTGEQWNYFGSSDQLSARYPLVIP